ncbi:cuticular protein 66D [Rhodnius prolixus]|uniref:Putative cuticular protein n=2 Tax=Rhodnius prolixus TaxID=13249 RepID=R4G833_RHOPR
MHKCLGVIWLAVLGFATAYPQTQEELAQYVARQQVGLGTQNIARRQAYLLQPQAKAVYQAAPKEQIYQVQPKQQVYQAAQPQQQYYQQVQQQPQQQYYQPQPANKLVRPGAPEQQDPEDYDPNPHYQFGFDIKDDEFTNYQGRKEQREGDKISGQYSVVDSDGYIRTVTYTADPLGGFKADVVREPTDIKIKFPTPAPLSHEIGGQGLAARKQQTQQYLQASAPVQKPQYALRPEHTQVFTPNQAPHLRQLAAYTGAQQTVERPRAPAYSQGAGNIYQAYQQ